MCPWLIVIQKLGRGSNALLWCFACACVYLCVSVPMYPDLCVGHADGVVSSQNRASAAEV